MSNKKNIGQEPNKLSLGKKILNKQIEFERDFFGDIVSEILDYTIEEIENIEKLMNIVWKIDDLIKLGKNISNSFEYNQFVIFYNKLNNRERKHFTKIYKEFRIIYFYEKISSNIKHGPQSKIANITKYLNNIRDEDFNPTEIKKLYNLLSESEKQFLNDNFEKNK